MPSVRRLKGTSRPVIGQADRAAMLAALACVHYVVVFDEDTPHRLLEAIRPDVLVKGGTYTPEEVVGHEIVTGYGGTVCVTGLVDGISTTNILASLARGEQAPTASSGRPFAASPRQAPCDAPDSAMKEKLTVIIPCKNERKNIRPCVTSAKRVADEVLVADSGSTDGSLDIVRSLGGCRIVEREYINSGNFKNWAIPQATHHWVLIVDSDERVTPELAAEINDLLAAGPKRDGYHIYRGQLLPWAPHSPCRLGQRQGPAAVSPRHGTLPGRKRSCRSGSHLGQRRQAKHRLEHFTYWTYDQYFQKLHRYTVQVPQSQVPGRPQGELLAHAARPATAVYALLHLPAWVSRRSGRPATQHADRLVVVRQTIATVGDGTTRCRNPIQNWNTPSRTSRHAA